MEFNIHAVGFNTEPLQGWHTVKAYGIGIYVSGCPARKVTNLVIENNFLSENNMGNHKFVRDIWADELDHAVIRNNFSAGTSAPNGLSPAQGIGKSCLRTVGEGHAVKETK